MHFFNQYLCLLHVSNPRVQLQEDDYTGRFIMYSEITKIYYRKTVEHVFTKPVQIAGTTTSPAK